MRRSSDGRTRRVNGGRRSHPRSRSATCRLERLAMRSVASSIWTSVQGDPVFMRRVNGWFTLFWLGMIPVSYELGWLNSVVYVSALSLWALVTVA